MVVFLCNGCGESCKKQVVEKHSIQCRKSGSWDCMDCHSTFMGDDYKAHTSCVTEAAKYGGKNYEHKTPKGQAKQEGWVEQVHSAIERCDPKDNQVKDVLGRLGQYTNIPRKQKPFVNFLINSFNLKRSPDVAQRAWDLISAATGKQQQQKDNVTKLKDANSESTAKDDDNDNQSHSNKKRKASETEETNGEESPKKKSKKSKKSLESATSSQEENEDENTGAESKFKWKSTLKSLVLAAPEKKIKLKQLKKKALKAYKEANADSSETDEQLRALFDEKLKAVKKAISVQGKVVVAV